MPDNTPLSLPATELLSTLAGSDYPQALVDSFPRIVNAIAELRGNPDDLKNYLDTLLRDMRGGRKGFSLEVLMNIQALRDFLIGPESDAEGEVKWF